MGLTGIALYYIGFNLALTYTSASQGALVQSSIPAVTAIAAVWCLGERLSRRRLLGIGFAIGGVLMIVARAAPDTDAPASGDLHQSRSSARSCQRRRPPW
jgi:drug/metabolite transporter (DMT)-like permease